MEYNTVPTQVASEQTRQRLLDAAIKEFSEHGYYLTNVDSITQRAGVSHGTFYLYFKKVYAIGGGKFNIPEDKKIDKPVTFSVDLIAVCDTTLTDGEQLVTLKPWTSGDVTKPVLS